MVGSLGVERTPSNIAVHGAVETINALFGVLGADREVLAFAVFPMAPLGRLGEITFAKVLQEVGDVREGV